MALGTFDGVHVGHRAIVAAAKKESTALGTDTAVLIFSASPHGAGCILPLGDRLREFRALGVNLAVVCDFDELRTLTPEAFVSEILIDKLGAVAVFAGYNYRFGAKAAGDTERLRALCAAQGVACHVTPCVELDGAPVSSTRIRALLAAEREKLPRLPDVAVGMTPFDPAETDPDSAVKQADREMYENKAAGRSHP